MSQKFILKLSGVADLVHHTEIIMLVIHVSGGVYNLENVDMEFAYRQYLGIKYINYIPWIYPHFTLIVARIWLFLYL